MVIKKKVSKYSYVKQSTESVIDLPTAPVFFQLWNFKQVIGIYPLSMNYTQNKEPVYKYTILVVDNHTSVQIRAHSMLSTAFSQIPEKLTERLEQMIVDLLIHDREYDSKISEDTFNRHYQNNIQYLSKIINPKE